MIRSYEITWYALNDTRYGREPLIRTSNIKIGRPRGVTSVDAKTAVDLFCKEFGNLKRNAIVSIKELDENGEQIGENILPTEDNGMIPIKRK